jgi:prophage antirepressor-like protein
MHDTRKSDTKKMTHDEEKFLNYSDAATLIGYRSYTKITDFVNSGILTSYSIPLSTRKRVKKTELVDLVFRSSLKNF